MPVTTAVPSRTAVQAHTHPGRLSRGHRHRVDVADSEGGLRARGVGGLGPAAPALPLPHPSVTNTALGEPASFLPPADRPSPHGPKPPDPTLMRRVHGEQEGRSPHGVEASEGGVSVLAHSCAVTGWLCAEWGPGMGGRRQGTWGRAGVRKACVSQEEGGRSTLGRKRRKALSVRLRARLCARFPGDFLLFGGWRREGAA